MMCHHSSPSSFGPEGRAWRKNDGAFEFLPKNRPDGSAAAAIPADQTVAIDFVAALLSQVARFEDQRRNRGPDPVDRWRGIAESEPPGDQRRGERSAAQAVGRLDAGRGQHGIARRGEVDIERAAGAGPSAIPAIDAGDGKDALIGGGIGGRGGRAVVTDRRDDQHAALLCARYGGRHQVGSAAELQSLMRISYAVFCLKKKKK